MNEIQYQIRNIEAHLTLDIRHQVMWPNKPRAYVELSNDTEGTHFGLFVNEELISVISVFIEKNEVQFRKFATLNRFQGKGFGSKLLEYVIYLMEKENCHKIWCNARVNKVKFYHKFGLKETEKTFFKGEIKYAIMERVYNK